MSWTESPDVRLRAPENLGYSAVSQVSGLVEGEIQMAI